MSDREWLLQIARLFAAAGYVDGKVFIRGDDGADVQAHLHAVTLDTERDARRHLVEV